MIHQAVDAFRKMGRRSKKILGGLVRAGLRFGVREVTERLPFVSPGRSGGGEAARFGRRTDPARSARRGRKMSAGSAVAARRRHHGDRASPGPAQAGGRTSGSVAENARERWRRRSVGAADGHFGATADATFAAGWQSLAVLAARLRGGPQVPHRGGGRPRQHGQRLSRGGRR
jgi:hypothetical protein